MYLNDPMQDAADAIIINALETVHERMTDLPSASHLMTTLDTYLSQRTGDPVQDSAWIQALLENERTEHLWPMRLFIADNCLKLQDEAGYNREVVTCVQNAREWFVLVSTVAFAVRLYVFRQPNVEEAVQFVSATMEQNQAIAPYLRTIYIEVLIEADDLEAAYEQLLLSIQEDNEMLTVEGLEILPILLARLNHWEDAELVRDSVQRFALEHLSSEAQVSFVESLVADVAEREQLGDLQTARFLMEVAKSIDASHPSVVGYMSIGIQMPKGWLQ